MIPFPVEQLICKIARLLLSCGHACNFHEVIYFFLSKTIILASSTSNGQFQFHEKLHNGKHKCQFLEIHVCIYLIS